MRGLKFTFRQRVWLIILAAALLIWLGGVWVSKLTMPQPLTPSGNELYDDFAQLLVDQYNPGIIPDRMQRWLSFLKLPAAKPYNPDCTSILAWESQYAGDPQYWQLRYFCRLDENPRQALIDSIERGVYDEGSFFELVTHPLEDNDMITEEDMLRYIDLGIEQNPDNSFYYFYKAFWSFGLGEIDATMDALNAGINAKQNYIPRSFPASIAEQLPPSALLEDDKFARGYILLNQPLTNFIFIKELYKNAQVCAALGFPLEFQDLLAEAAVKMMEYDNSFLIELLVAHVLCGLATTQTAQEYLELDESQMIEYYYLRSLRQKINSTIKNYRRPTSPARTYKEELINFFKEHVEERIVYGKVCELTPGLLPPPMAAWGRGELAGYEIPDEMRAMFGADDYEEGDAAQEDELR